MKNYVTSDKVGEFIQCMFDAGIYASVDGDQIAVRMCDHSYIFIDIYRKRAFQDLRDTIVAKDAELKKQAEFDKSFKED